MKRFFISLFSLILLSGASQTSRDVFRGGYIPPITKEVLKGAYLISDVIPNCPKHWNQIIDILSVKILAVCDGEAKLAEGKTEKITLDQYDVLNGVDEGTEISIKIEFKWKDVNSALVDNGTIQTMNEFKVAIVPDTEAQFPGGPKELREYLEKNIEAKVPKPSKDKPRVSGATVVFVINEYGKVSEAKILPNPSADPEIDKMLLDAINKMPDWKPALNAKGEKVKQGFKYRIRSGVYNTGGC